ncbi:MAG: hypothetical protein JSU69_10395 [Candidatus Zixiibacteriota bacterium]|nr:MAG: hypothetical protein JSU69_10395 [candidate division Zixibacteria bacterium]
MRQMLLLCTVGIVLLFAWSLPVIGDTQGTGSSDVAEDIEKQTHRARNLTAFYGSGDVEVHLNGGDDVAYIGDTNIVEIWIKNDAVVKALGLGFEFSIGRIYQFNPNHGGAGKYVKEQGDAVGAMDLLFTETPYIDNVTLDSIYFTGAAIMAGLPVHASHSLCYSMAVYIPAGQDPLTDGFCIDNIFIPPSGSWTFYDDAGSYAPTYQGNTNSSQSDPDAPAVCFDIVRQFGEMWWKEPNGIYMPDFDQNQNSWSAYCGPTAAANCLWWFDSLNPQWGLVPDGWTAPQFIDALAVLMSTNVAPSSGTHVDSMQSGIRQWLAQRNCMEYLIEATYYDPTYEFCLQQLLDCQDVILLMGFWVVSQIIPDTPSPGCFQISWYRENGHFVTMAGADTLGSRIGISDPDKDAAETSLPCPPSRVLGPNHGHPTGHNDGVSVSHDVYEISTLGISPGGLWEVFNYAYVPKFTSVEKYGPETNPHPNEKRQDVTIWCDDLPGWVYPGAIVTEVEAAVIVCPRPPVRDTVTCEPQGGNNPSHPPTYWYEINPGFESRCDFHVKVLDSVAGHYSNWQVPTGWSYSLHKTGGNWWVSWWSPGCANPIDTTFRVGFDNSSQSVWNNWRTTVDGSDDPFAQVIDSAENHTADADGYGHRVHVPYWEPPPVEEITLDAVEGLDPSGKIIAGRNVKFIMRWTYRDSYPVVSFSNGFRVYSPDGATWQSIVGDTMNIGWPSVFDLGVYVGYNSANGSGADTVGFYGAKIMAPGAVPPFDKQVWWIETKVDAADVGKHLCVDSSTFNPPAGDWLWNTDYGLIYPDWDGPHCFEIVKEDSLYWKPPYPNYAPHEPGGMPDFDQKQDNWMTLNAGANGIMESTPAGDDELNQDDNLIAPGLNCHLETVPDGDDDVDWSFSGPAALANCFWWFDSKYADSTGYPGDGLDIFPLVQGQYDPGDKEIDQEQTMWDYPSGLIDLPTAPWRPGHVQSFTPTVTRLDAVQLLLDANLPTLTNVEVSIYDALPTGPSVTPLGTSTLGLSLNDSTWVQFHFTPPINLIPGNVYYITARSIDVPNNIHWCFTASNPYPYGMAWWCWGDYILEEKPDHDFAFKTEYYGLASVDDHAAENVPELIEELARRMGTAIRGKTDVNDMQDAIQIWLEEKGLDDMFTESTYYAPDFYFIEEEIERSQDVILQLGFYEFALTKVVDQEQPLYDAYIDVPPWHPGHVQSFTPAVPILDAVQLLFRCNYFDPSTVEVSIYDVIPVGPAATPLGTSIMQVSGPWEPPQWYQFHFEPPLHLIPGNVYYIEVVAYNMDYNIHWCFTWYDSYPGGIMYYNPFQPPPDSLEPYPDQDFAFKTEYYDYAECSRVGQQYVTCAGVNSDELLIAFSDPYRDVYNPAAVDHNDAQNVSHDIYTVAVDNPCPQLDYQWWLPDFPSVADMTLVEYAVVICPTEECDCIPGDADGDGKHLILDVTHIINYLYKNGPPPTPYALCSGDADCDCSVLILDVTYLINYLYKNGPPPCDCQTWLSLCGSPLRK